MQWVAREPEKLLSAVACRGEVHIDTKAPMAMRVPARFRFFSFFACLGAATASFVAGCCGRACAATASAAVDKGALRIHVCH